PWVSTHSYNHYAYDPACGMLVSGRGYLYDPDRMDWIRAERIPLPYAFDWGHTVIESSPHGAVAWARKKGMEDAGLWLFDRERGWIDLEPRGALFTPYCDAHGMVYDAKRDRMIIGGVGGAYQKRSSGALLAFDFKTRAIAILSPKNAAAGCTRNAREMAYIERADWIVFGELLRRGNEEKGKPYTRIYDCAKDAYFLLDAGEVAEGHSAASMYDARRGLAYVFTFRGEAWALRIDPASVRLLERPEG
ncbi:MAG: hypothetical protein JXP34_19405, partial [Planctomycetes bacterium]|nr:hypothetical protein [Planctomycetota bacterium]